MLKYLYTAILSILFTSGYSQYILIWQDEFEQNGLPNSQQWSYDLGGNGFGNEELQYYTKERPENARVENGKLIIKAQKESYNGNDYTSAKLQTRAKADWKYGRFEIRAKLPAGRGIWPAIWMLPTQSVYGTWPGSGEIDIMELVGYDPDKVHFTIHTDAYNHKIGTQKGANTIISNSSQNFHTYALEWTEDSLKFFVDNQIHFTVKKNAGDDYKKWPFDQPFYLILNVAVGGSWGGAQGIDNSIFPQTMEVDYVRVYKKAEPESHFPIHIYTSNGTVNLEPELSLYERGSEVKATAVPDEGFEFKSWSGTYSGTNPNTTWPVYFPYEVKATFSRIGEMLENSTFFNGTMLWDYYGATMQTKNDQLHIAIPTATTNPWDIQVSQQGLNLKAGETYIFRFKAAASTTRSINAGVGISQDPWTAFLSKTVTLTQTEQEFVYEFTMPVNEQNGRVFFDLGKFAGDIIISEISLVQMGSLTAKTPAKNIDRVNIYPNPSKGRVNIEGHNSAVTILNAEGKIVSQSQNTEQIDLSNLPNGVYFIKTDKGVVQMVVKE